MGFRGLISISLLKQGLVVFYSSCTTAISQQLFSNVSIRFIKLNISVQINTFHFVNISFLSSL